MSVSPTNSRVTRREKRWPRTAGSLIAVGRFLSRWRLMGSELHLLKVEAREDRTPRPLINGAAGGVQRWDQFLILSCQVHHDGLEPSLLQYLAMEVST